MRSSCQPSSSPPTRAVGAGTRLRSPARHREPSGLGQIPDGDGHEGSDGRRQQRRIAQSATSTSTRTLRALPIGGPGSDKCPHAAGTFGSQQRRPRSAKQPVSCTEDFSSPACAQAANRGHHPLRGASWTAGSTSFAPRWWIGLQSLTSRGKSRRSISSVRTTVRRRLGRTALEDPRGRGV